MGRQYITLISLVAASAFAQSSDPKLTFEVASVKAAAPQGNGRMMMGGGGGPGSRDPGRFTMTNMPLKMLLARAYDVKDYQVQGPGWLDSERFDIVAKVPPGTTKEHFNVMYQNLLIERFKIELHKDKKELPIFTLGVGKNGPKLKETELDASAFAPPTPDGGGRGGPGNASIGLPPPPPPGMGRGGFPTMPAGRPGMIVMFQEGHMRMTAVGQNIAGIANFISMQLGRPVIDNTGLTGRYDFQMDFAPEQGMGPGRGMMMAPPPPGGGGGVGGGDGGGPASAASDPAPNLVTAVQQLGLKLDSGKGPVDLIVVDKAEKVPIEN
jgi:uncharacterized protein (TIGR03435 family)